MYNVSVTIDDVVTSISESDLVDVVWKVDNQVKFNFDDLIASTIEVVLNNTEGTYDDDDSDSIFYGDDWYNSIITIKDDDDLVIWNGRLKNITKKDKNKKITLLSKNFIQEIIDTECKISKGSSTDITVSEMIYWLLTEIVGVPKTSIRKKGFEDGESLQEANDVFVRLSFDPEKTESMSCSNIIKSLCRMTSSYIYVQDNIIHYNQPQDYDGTLGEILKEDEIIQKTFETKFNDKEIANRYFVYFIDGAGVDFNDNDSMNVTLTGDTTDTSPIITDITTTNLTVGDALSGAGIEEDVTITEVGERSITISKDATATQDDVELSIRYQSPVSTTQYIKDSINTYGVRDWKIPKNGFNTDDETDYAILLKNSTGATWCGELKVSLHHHLLKECKIQLKYDKSYINLNDQIDLNWGNYIREPVRIFKKKTDTKKKIITLTGEFRNIPYEYRARDVTVPENTHIFGIFYDTDKAIILWNPSSSPDVNRYDLYIGTNDDFFTGIATEGVSPIKITNQLSLNGFHYKLLSGLTESDYNFKLVVVDSTLNESDDSNTINLKNIGQNTIYENTYRVIGDIYEDLQATDNSAVGDFNPSNAVSTYDSLNYDMGTWTFCGVYESPLIASINAWDYIVFKTSDFEHHMGMQVRYYDYDIAAFTAWATVIPNGRTFKVPGENYTVMQVRILFDNTTTKIYLYDTKEV